ncbi:Integrase [Corynebacterium glyciniphilum AJ 3170]|uniref:Integrase n=1 Tax=Corynebacterium glyciniphilum AJ 3170 TaxID=1404245 RepID=X5DW42_9CORY|nr:site-specific integrase [Corynebacterium glyciniphilum]AHW65549.1 Integrase [Corynebacterium glyciniphilum AJ 3170]
MGRPKSKPKKRRFGATEELRSGKFRARYTYRGRRWTSPRTFLSRGRAEGWLDSEERLIDRGDWTPPAEREAQAAAVNVSLNEAVDRWIRTAGHLAESSRRLYQSIRRNRIEPYLSDVLLPDFTRSHAYRWVDDIRRDHGGITKRNADAYKLLHAALQAEVNSGTLDANPCQVKGATLLPEREHKAVPNLQQLRVIVDNMPEHYRAGTEIAAWCGLRSAEWQELRRRDVERHQQPPAVDGSRRPDRVILHVDRQAQKRGGEWTVTPPKGGKTRTVVVPDHLVRVIDEQLASRSNPGRDGLLFPNGDGQQVTRQKYYNAFKLRAAEAGCPKASPHSLRHFGGTAYAQAGATVREMMDYLGHSTPDVAMGYQHTAADRPVVLAAAMSALAGVVPGAPGVVDDGDRDGNGDDE